jgi:predicted RecA/RadA family phage recombinase
MNQSVTIVEQAGANIEDVRNRIMTYDKDGNVILAADGSTILIGVALIEAGINDISGVESGKVNVGDDVDIQIKDIGYILAGGEIAKGNEVTASNGLAVKAESGNYVVGIALSTVAKDDYCRVQIAKYQKA